MSLYTEVTEQLPKPFSWKESLLWYLFGSLLVLRLVWAMYFPMANDEVYYWEWARFPQMSYVDAPPLVAWQAYVGGLLFDHALGARFLVPFFHLFSTIFIILSAEKFTQIQQKLFTNEIAYSAFAICQLAPVFNLEGFLLLPDSGLLFGLSGSLYFLLLAIAKSKNSQTQTLPIKYGVFFGIFLGVAGLSKYHALPIALGFFIAVLLYRGIKNTLADLPFWLVTFIFGALIASPVFIWNYQHQFASFHFQSQHGFANFAINIKAFLKFLVGTIFYIYPWLFIALALFVIQHCRKNLSLQNINNIVVFPFILLFVLILFSALGKQALPHWTMPGFFLLIPAFVVNWQPLSKQYTKQWTFFFKLSCYISLLVPSILCLPKTGQFMIQMYLSIKGNADDLFQVYAWRSLQLNLKKQALIDIQTTNFNDSTPPCTENNYILASLKWYWTSQIAYHFNQQPKVYNFDFVNSSFYIWRDQLYQLANCNVVIIGSKDHYDPNRIEKVVDIKEFRLFTLFPFIGENLVYIKGKMKEESQLRTIYEQQTSKIKY